jgi:hypothetical protein
MGIKDLIFKEIEKVPEQHLPEVLDFIRSLEEGKVFTEKIGTAIASETSLKKDWLRPEEDKAWKDL